MSACIVLLCNAQHNGWRWAICISLCNHKNVFIAFEAVWVGMSSLVNVRI